MKDNNSKSDNVVRLLKGYDVAQILNVSRAYAYQLMRQGEIPTVQIGKAVRVRVEDVMIYIEQNTRR